MENLDENNKVSEKDKFALMAIDLYMRVATEAKILNNDIVYVLKRALIIALEIEDATRTKKVISLIEAKILSATKEEDVCSAELRSVLLTASSLLEIINSKKM